MCRYEYSDEIVDIARQFMAEDYDRPEGNSRNLFAVKVGEV